MKLSGTAAAHRLVPRARLFDLLSAGRPGGVTLVSAPAGSGKTTLLRSWIHGGRVSDCVAWVSVERDERDAQRFWRSLIGELSAAVGDRGSVQELSPTPEFDGHATVLRLLSDIASLDQSVVLVIDDLHELNSNDANTQLEFLLARLPPVLRVVLGTRHDPQIGLHRLRLAGDLTELRGPDLRFMPDETRDLLNGAGIALSDTAALQLHERTEGWAAGLRLAALSLAGHPEPQRFVTEFSGSERTVAEYLLAEVLDRLPEDVRHLLLRTSILESVSGPLADVLTGSHGSERILQALEEANAFVVSLDVGRNWFRYHHLFTDLLRLELRRTAPNDVRSLHRAAAEWFTEAGQVVDAIAHMQAAGEWHQAARLLADHDISLALDGRGATIRALLGAFPDSASSSDAELAVVFAGAEIERGSLDKAAAHFDVALRLAARVPEDRRRRFDVALGVGTLGLASRRGDLVAALEISQMLEAALGAPTKGAVGVSIDARALALMNLGIVEVWSSRFEEARRDLEASLEWARRIGRPYVEIGCLGHLAIATHSVTESVRLSTEAIGIAERHGWESSPFVALAMVAYGGALVWAGHFADAERWFDRAESALPSEAEPATALLLHYLRGLMHAAQGQLERALRAFRAAERMSGLLAGEHRLSLQMRSFSLQTQLRIGDVDAVRAHVTAIGEERLPAELVVVLAALHLADDNPQRAVDALDPIIGAPRPRLAPRELIQALLVHAVAHDRLGDRPAAEAAVERALELAEPEQVILPFALAPVRELVERLPQHRTAHARLQSDILEVLAGLTPQRRETPLATTDLSDAEMRVLRYLPSNLTAPAIAAELRVSTNTIKTHMSHIYSKLNTHGRTEAVDRARQLGLLGPQFRAR